MILDTSAIVELADRRAKAHRRIVELVTGAQDALVVPAAVLGEAGYMLESRVGAPGSEAFLEKLAAHAFTVSWDVADAREGKKILRQCPSAGMTDALVAACSLRLNLPVLTLDRSDFMPLSLAFGFALVPID